MLFQARLEGGFVGGYRTTTIPLTIHGNASQIVCQGNYELWWVQRTLWGFVTQVIALLLDIDASFPKPVCICLIVQEKLYRGCASM